MKKTLVAFLLLINSTLPAAQGGTLTLQGQVIDPTHAAMPGVTVTVKRDGNKLPRLAISDAVGRYVLSGLQPGNYELVSDAPDFVREPKIIKLTTSTDLDLTLNVKSIGTCPGPDCAGLNAIAAEILPAPEPGVVRARLNAERAAAMLWQFTIRMEGTERSDRTNKRSYQVLQEFQLLGKDAVPALSLALQDEDVQVRRNAAVVLAFFVKNVVDAREALPVLRERLQDSDTEVRQVARRVVEAIE